MADMLIRDRSPAAVARLKQSAKKHGRSLQAHLTLLLEEASPFTMVEAATATRRSHTRLKGRRFQESAARPWRGRSR